MEFDKSKVYTVLNADEVKIGSKGYFAATIADLRITVEGDWTLRDVKVIRDDNWASRFEDDDGDYYSLFYLVEEPKEKELNSYKDTDEMISHFCKHFNIIPQVHSLPRIWVKGKPEGKYEDEIVQVMGFFKGCNSTVTVGRSCDVENKFTLYELFKNFTYLDGTPCGIEEE